MDADIQHDEAGPASGTAGPGLAGLLGRAARLGRRIGNLSLTSALGRILLSKLDVERHCEWTVHGPAGLKGKGHVRMRPARKLHPPVSRARAFESP
jgi:hypothetical protein